METTGRIWVKAVTWQGMGLLSMTLLGYLFTGSFGQGGLLALVSCGISLCIYVLHEKLWCRVKWGRVEVK